MVGSVQWQKSSISVMERFIQEHSISNLNRVERTEEFEVGNGTTRLLLDKEYYVIVEGENTERFYMRMLEKTGKLKYKIRDFEKDVNNRDKFGIVIEGIKCLCGGDNYFKKMNKIEKLGKGIESVPGQKPKFICIFDLDVCIVDDKGGLKKYQEYTKLLKTFEQYIKNKDIILCASMPSIEYWFLSHYEEMDDDKFYDTSDSVIDDLKLIDAKLKIKNAKRFWNTLYSKDWVNNVLCDDTNFNRAISRAKAKANHSKRLDKVDDRMKCDVSYSDMYKLFEIK